MKTSDQKKIIMDSMDSIGSATESCACAADTRVTDERARGVILLCPVQLSLDVFTVVIQTIAIPEYSIRGI